MKKFIHACRAVGVNKNVYGNCKFTKRIVLEEELRLILTFEDYYKNLYNIKLK